MMYLLHSPHPGPATWPPPPPPLNSQVPKGVHGSIVNDGYFATGVAWSPDGGAVAYVAEMPAAERTPAWGGPDSLKVQGRCDG